MSLALIIPFHNEDHHLPRLIRSLRAQTAPKDVPVVFIDNGSVDGSAAIVQRCAEVKKGKWWFLEERKIGKFHAMKTALAFCREQFGATHIGLIDADCYFSDDAWVHNSLEIMERAGRHFGYTYSLINYSGFEELPTFKAAYLIYERILRLLMVNVGWLANGQAFVCSADTLTHYFDNAEITTEFDLRCSLLALSNGQQAFVNPTVLLTSGRRIVVNARNFSAWCFYEREFYSKKDINAKVKLDLKRAERLQDMQPAMVGHFFKRRAIKITSRHLIPFAVFSRESSVFGKIGSLLGIDVAEELSALSRQFRNDADVLLTDRFETMIQAIENDRVSIAVAKRIESLMCREYELSASSAQNLYALNSSSGRQERQG